MDDKNFLAEIDALLSRLPSMEVFSRFDGPADMWLGHANAVLKSKLHGGEQVELGSLNHAIERGDYLGISRPVAIRGLLRLIHMVRHKLLMATGGTGAVVFDKGMHYQYFEAIRGIIQTATRELFIVDPYLDADVLSRFVGCAGADVRIRLLGKKNVQALLPAVQALNKERGTVQFRSIQSIHDRFVFVDSSKCHFSGGSFAAGPTNAPTLVVELVDAAPQALALYEDKWANATVQPL